MRLLDTTTLELTEFHEHQIPSYAILSHTWGEEEVTIQEMVQGTGREKLGFQKIVECCKRARNDSIGYVWVDTCCIDKTSSAELSEAINSMFTWYRASTICYAFLDDVDSGAALELASRHSLCEKVFRNCRWFRRGWTLQELLAPRDVTFLDASWYEFGTRYSLKLPIRAVTGIDMLVLEGNPGALERCSVATRMSWASNRETTRVEDIAYSLMGIFDVNMPLLYGEGPKAFLRLQEEIMKQSDDYTIFAWKSNGSRLFRDYCIKANLPYEQPSDDSHPPTVSFSAFSWPLAAHPSAFSSSECFTMHAEGLTLDVTSNAFSTGNRGLLMTTGIIPSRRYPFDIAVLPVRARWSSEGFTPSMYTGIYIMPLGNQANQYIRVLPGLLVGVEENELPSPRTFIFTRTRASEFKLRVREKPPAAATMRVIAVHPHSQPNQHNGELAFQGFTGSLAGGMVVRDAGGRDFIILFGLDKSYCARYISLELVDVAQLRLPSVVDDWYRYVLSWLHASPEALGGFARAGMSFPFPADAEPRTIEDRGPMYAFKVRMGVERDAQTGRFRISGDADQSENFFTIMPPVDTKGRPAKSTLERVRAWRFGESAA